MMTRRGGAAWPFRDAEVEPATYLTFDAMRLAVGCAARSVRDQRDYGVFVLADKRFGKPDKQRLAPAWLRELMGEAVLNLSTDDAVNRARLFLRHKAQEGEQAAAPSAMSLEQLRSHAGYVEAALDAKVVKPLETAKAGVKRGRDG